MPRIALVLAFCALLTTGCLTHKDHVTLKADGSGTFVAVYMVDMAKGKELINTAMTLFGGGGGGGEMPSAEEMALVNPYAPVWFREAGKGVDGYSVTGATEVATETTRANVMSASFTSLEAAAKGGAFFAASVTLSKVDKSERLPNGAWKLVFREALAGGGEALGGMDPAQMLPMFEAQLSGFSVKRAVTLPCAILETNGKASADKMTVEWTVNYDKILEGKDLEMTVVFEAKEEVKLKPFKFSPDIMALVPRFTQPPPGAKAEAKPEPKKEEAAPTTGGGDK